MKGVNMITIQINSSASYDNLPVLKEMLQESNWKLKSISMVYNPAKGLPSMDAPEQWPFLATFDSSGREVLIRIYTLTVGYSGTGPHDFASILDFFGIQYEEDDIYTKRLIDNDGYIRLHYWM